MELGSSPDGMARSLWFITLTGVVIYVAAVLLLIGTSTGADSQAPEPDTATAAPTFTASAH